MTLQASNKSAALNELYSRIMQIAGAMGGTASQSSVSISMPSAMVVAPRGEHVPALYVEMPNGFRVEFTPSLPLNTPFVLSVQVRRTHHGLPKNGWMFNFCPDGWRRTLAPLSDDEIRECLTPDGPMPAVY
jgi:hypothetical protein